LWADLLHLGRLQVRGRYVENYGSRHAKPMDVRAYLVIGRSDDSGNLKGALRKYGRQYEQDAVIHKGYYRDAERHPQTKEAETDMSGLQVTAPHLDLYEDVAVKGYFGGV
jgi:hypothetical protein